MIYSCHNGFNTFDETFFDKRIAGTNLQFSKIMLNGLFSYDRIDTIVYINLNVCNENKTRAAILAHFFIAIPCPTFQRVLNVTYLHILRLKN